jgi:arylsulfatase A-like enzyme
MAEWLGVEPFALPPAAVDGLVGRSLAGNSPADSSPAGSSPADRILLAEALAYGPDLVAIRQESWKLIASRAGDVFGLYDLATDPHEKTDLTAARPDIARHLLAHLAAWRVVNPDDDDPGSATSWNDVDTTVRQRLKDLGYTD